MGRAPVPNQWCDGVIIGHIELWKGLSVGVGEIVFQAMGVAVLHEYVCCPTVGRHHDGLVDGENAMQGQAW